MEKENCCGHRVKERSTAEYKDLINRLNRIEGQVRGIKKNGGEPMRIVRIFWCSRRR